MKPDNIERAYEAAIDKAAGSGDNDRAAELAADLAQYRRHYKAPADG